MADARKTRIGKSEALKLARSVKRIVAAKGKKIVTLDAKASDAEILAAILGPSGNLRAPAAKVGKTLFVGFSDEAYRELAELKH